MGVDALSISRGVVRDNKFVCGQGRGAPKVETVMIDAPGVYGNSGGPIVDSRNKIIGIYTLGFTRTDSMGGGPSALICRHIVKHLKSKDYREKKFLGIDYRTVTAFDLENYYIKKNPPVKGVIITRVDKESPFPLKKNDLLLEMSGVTLGNQIDQRSPSLFFYCKKSSILIKWIRGFKKYKTWVNLTKTFADVDIKYDVF